LLEEFNGVILEAQSKVHIEKIIKTLEIHTSRGTFVLRRFRNEMAYNYIKRPVIQSMNPHSSFFSYYMQASSEGKFSLTMVSTLVNALIFVYLGISRGPSLAAFMY